MYLRQWEWLSVCGMSVLIAGCVNDTMSARPRADPVAEFQRLVEDQQFYEAYVSYLGIRSTLGQMDEGAGGCEYQRLVASTSGVGQEDWARILESPIVPLYLKLDLVKEIDETSRRVP